MRRIETMALLGDNQVPLDAVRAQITGAVDLVVHVTRTGTGAGRRVEAVAEVVPGPAGAVETVALTAPGGAVVATCTRPARRHPIVPGANGAAGDGRPPLRPATPAGGSTAEAP